MYIVLLKINVQAEYRQKTPTVAPNGAVVEDDDFIPPEPPPRTDYGKKALVSTDTVALLRLQSSTSLGTRGTKLPSAQVHGFVPSLRHQLSHALLQSNAHRVIWMFVEQS